MKDTFYLTVLKSIVRFLEDLVEARPEATIQDVIAVYKKCVEREEERLKEGAS